MTSRIPISAHVWPDARRPTVVTWNRLEGNPRSEDFARSLRAEVRDALWMLSRQWQVGEYAAKDAGTPVVARVTTEVEQLATFMDAAGAASSEDLAVPLEVRVERERVPHDLRLAVQAGHHWLRLLRARLGDDRYRALFLQAYALAEPAAGDVRVTQWFAAHRGRALDGLRLLADFANGVDAITVSANGDTIGILDHPEVALAQQELTAWFARTATQPKTETTWSPAQLEYRFGITTSSPSGAGTMFGAAEYHGGTLDWHDFDVVKQAPARAPITITASMLPAPISFVGMPAVRWWEVEDQRLDFGALTAHPSDLLSLLLAEFGLVYGSDWSVLPLKTAVGSLTRVTELVVIDVFGQHVSVPSLHQPNSPWAMFTLTNGANAGLFVPPALAHVIESAPVECVDLLRDEMANMVWALETIVPDGLGSGIDGRTNEPLAAAPTAPRLRYELMGTVPRSWIPFIPTHVTGSSREVQLQRGSMISAGGSRVEPRGEILRASTPYLVHEEEVTRAGVRVARTWQRARWFDGRTYVWLGRARGLGRGEGSSGIAFDRLRDPAE
jgi:hypothetical protein